MFHEFSSAQIVLFEIGALFQFIAICTYTRERLACRHGDRLHLEPDPNYHDKPPTVSRPKVSLAKQASAYRVRSAPPLDENESPTMNAAELLKTAKVKFKQNLKFRDE